jgi:hypothetical protein
MNAAEMSEVFEIQKEEAIQKVVRLLKLYQIDINHLSKVYPEILDPESAMKVLPGAKLFDPFFDVR